MNDEEQLGFAGRLMAGQSTVAAWNAITEGLKSDPDAQAILLKLAETPEGREWLRESRGDWLIRGLAPPWEAILGAIDEEPAE
jgi:hypothetical protein